jgi:hypothetical protein
MANKNIVPGTLIQDKTTGKKAIVEFTSLQAFQNGSNSEVSLLWLDNNEEIDFSSAWHSISRFNILDSDIEENLKKIVKYNRKEGEGAPIGMKPEMAKKLGYTSIHTYSSAMSGRKRGDIKIN